MHPARQHPETVAEAAASALAAAKGDAGRAAQALAARVRSEPALRRSLLEPLIDAACADAVGAIIRHSRARTWTLPRADLAPADRVRALGATNLLMFPLPGGKLLGDATRAEIAAAAEFYARQAADMAAKSRWLQLVAQSIPDGKIARKVLSAERLRELQEEAARA